jgi:beta-glucan synthesis-associated protein KRE6
MREREPDDDLHNPDPTRDLKNDRGGHIFTGRGIANLGCLFVLSASALTLFAGVFTEQVPLASLSLLTSTLITGYPIISHFLKKQPSDQGGFGLGGTNGTGQVAKMPGNFALIDLDTPQDAYTKASYMNPNDQWDLVFSDEFNVDGRTFYPGDDPFWEAVCSSCLAFLL